MRACIGLLAAIITASSPGVSAQNRSSGQAVNPAVFGTWKLNLQKSEFSGVAPIEQVRTYSDAGGGLVEVTVEGISGDGKPTQTHYVARFDGRDYPREVRGARSVGTIALKIVDDNTVDYIQKEDGRISITGTRTLSEDGKEMIVNVRGTNAQGQAVTSTQAFDKIRGPAATHHQ